VSRYRYPEKGSQYYIDPLLYDFCIRYARMYPAWKKELATDPDEDRRKELNRRIECIDLAAGKAAPDDVLTGYLLQSVTGDNVSVITLQSRGMPCGKDVLQSMRRRFYYELSQIV